MDYRRKAISGRVMILAIVAIVMAPGTGSAQIPPAIAARLQELGRVVWPEETAKLYRPLQPTYPYKGVTVSRDISFGPDARDVVDVFAPASGRGSSLPVLLFVSGGQGNKRGEPPDDDAFYDNIMLGQLRAA